MKHVWLESLENVEANHANGFDFWKTSSCIIIKGKVMPIMEPIVKHLFVAII